MRTSAILLIGLATCSCGAFAESRSWSFVQSVGGIAVSAPVRTDRYWQLPVQADVSGLKIITTKPTTMNSGIACNRVRAEVEGTSIYLTVQTTMAGDGRSAQCPPAELKNIPPGKYRVFYRGPNEPALPIGEISLVL